MCWQIDWFIDFGGCVGGGGGFNTDMPSGVLKMLTFSLHPPYPQLPPISQNSFLPATVLELHLPELGFLLLSIVEKEEMSLFSCSVMSRIPCHSGGCTPSAVTLVYNGWRPDQRSLFKILPICHARYCHPGSDTGWLCVRPAPRA